MWQLHKRTFQLPLLFSVTALLCVLCAAVLVIVFLQYKHSSPCAQAADRSHCRQEVVRTSLASGDIGGAERQVALFANDPTFAKVCHTLMHDIGKKAYQEYASGRSFTYTADMEMCSFGFFHGFMEALIGETHDLKEAGRFCTGEGATKVSIPRDECFHGIGHGVVDEHDPHAWANVQALVDRSLSFCRSVHVSSDDFIKCVGGVYNGIANAYWTNEYDLSIDADDPFKICRTVTASERPDDCYGYMARTLIDPLPTTFQSAIDAALAHTPAQFRKNVIAGIVILFPHRTVTSTEVAHVCSGLPDDLNTICLNSYAQGIVQASGPDHGKARAMEFCTQFSNEKAQCVETVSNELKKYEKE